ncbi:hypothetical protein ACH42_10820 [Endozoicomonas sp. (ex Bugula neritina AB1)]|nr:hypothetical protein ACH42_10820 [Endozoicomonas sp. (ex Bugula neritina AB1)]
MKYSISAALAISTRPYGIFDFIWLSTYIPIAFEDVGVLAALTHPNHLLLVGSWGFAHLPSTHISKSNGYTIGECIK